jgi:hypothetical protein
MSFFEGVTICCMKLASLEEVGLKATIAALVELLCCPHPIGGTTLLNGTLVEDWYKVLDLMEDADKVCQVSIYIE